MMGHFNRWRPLAAAVFVAVAGIQGWIDQSTMIVLAGTLVVLMASGRRACLPGRSA